MTAIKEAIDDAAKQADANMDLMAEATGHINVSSGTEVVNLTKDNPDQADIVETKGVQECDIKIKDSLFSDNVSEESLGTIHNEYQGQFDL